MNAYSIAADIVVVFHFSYVLFILVGLACILLGRILGWQWIRNPWFRLLHLATIGIVVVESLLAITCPLTTLENYLRGLAGQTVRDGSFVGRVAHDLLFIEATPAMFQLLYCGFGGLVLLTLLLIPPRLGKSQRQGTPY